MSGLLPGFYHKMVNILSLPHEVSLRNLKNDLRNMKITMFENKMQLAHVFQISKNIFSARDLQRFSIQHSISRGLDGLDNAGNFHDTIFFLLVSAALIIVKLI